MYDVLKHPFFWSLDGDKKDDHVINRLEKKVDSIRKDMAKLSSNLAVLSAEFEKSVRLLKANFHIMTEIVEETHQVPGLMVFLPIERDHRGILSSWVECLKDPQKAVSTLLNQTVRLHFVCPLTYVVAGQGFELERTEEWVKDVAPFLKV
eukprot:scaffold87173_cov21-Prasinocladus_malaysianus.AAC.1